MHLQTAITLQLGGLFILDKDVTQMVGYMVRNYTCAFTYSNISYHISIFGYRFDVSNMFFRMRFFSTLFVIECLLLNTMLILDYFFTSPSWVQQFKSWMWQIWINWNRRENCGTLGWYPGCLSPPRSPLKGDIPNKYPLYKVYMGLIIKGTIPRVPQFSLWW